MKTVLLLLRCPDQMGIVAQLTQCLSHHECNIIEADQYRSEECDNTFFVRIAFAFIPEQHNIDAIFQDLNSIAEHLQASWSLHDLDHPLKVALLLSKDDHCLSELLYLWKSQELTIDITHIISNHHQHQKIATQHEIPFDYLDTSDKAQAEQKLLALTQDSTDFLILARYMQILSADFLMQYGKDVINIHHSFLPSFKGANPYQKAFNRGVKVIGATAHFITTDLDEGPIITQLVEPVSHKDNVNQLKQKGRVLEKHTLAQAVRHYSQHRIIRCKNKTVVFA